MDFTHIKWYSYNGNTDVTMYRNCCLTRYVSRNIIGMVTEKGKVR